MVACIRCRGNVFTGPLPCNDRRDIHTDTQTDGRDLWSMPLRWAREHMLHIPNLIKIRWGIQKLIEWGHRQHGDFISLLSFFRNKESRLNMERFMYWKRLWKMRPWSNGGTKPASALRNWGKNHVTPQSGHPVSQPIFSDILAKCVPATSNPSPLSCRYV
jgi:hypothetical protein